MVSRAEERKPIACGLHAQKALGGGSEGVLPARRMELAVLAADERLGEPVRVVDEVEREAALDAEVALVRDVVGLRGHLHDPLRLQVDVQVELAAHSAERAGRLHLLEAALGAVGSLFELLVDRSGRAGREASSAELALGIEPGVAVRGDDSCVRPAALERESRALHDLLRVPHAAVAEDARVGVVAHEPVAVVVGLPLRVRKDERRLGVELLREIDELVRAPAGIRVQVLGEQHLGQRLAELRDGRVRGHGDSRGDPRRAGGQRPGRALHVDHAHPAAAVGVELVVVAEGGDEDAVPGGGVDEELALGRAHRPAVEREGDDAAHRSPIVTGSPSGAKVSGQ
jgi:hypothetical protein